MSEESETTEETEEDWLKQYEKEYKHSFTYQFEKLKLALWELYCATCEAFNLKRVHKWLDKWKT